MFRDSVHSSPSSLQCRCICSASAIAHEQTRRCEECDRHLRGGDFAAAATQISNPNSNPIKQQATSKPVMASDDVARLRADGLSADRIDELRVAFQMFDIDGSNTITTDNIGALLNQAFGRLS